MVRINKCECKFFANIVPKCWKKSDFKKELNVCLSVKLFFNAITFFLQMFIIKSVSGDHVDLDAFDISGSKYTPEGEV